MNFKTRTVDFLSSGAIVLLLLAFLVINSVYSGWKSYQYEIQVAIQQKYVIGRINNNLLQLKTCFDTQDRACEVLLVGTEVQLALLQTQDLELKYIYSLVKRYVVVSSGSEDAIAEAFRVAKINNEISADVNDVEVLKQVLKERYLLEIRRIQPQKITEA